MKESTLENIIACTILTAITIFVMGTFYHHYKKGGYDKFIERINPSSESCSISDYSKHSTESLTNSAYGQIHAYRWDDN